MRKVFHVEIVRKKTIGSRISQALTSSWPDGSTLAVQSLANADPEDGAFTIRNASQSESGEFTGVDESKKLLTGVTRPAPLNWPSESRIEYGEDPEVRWLCDGYDDDSKQRMVGVELPSNLKPFFKRGRRELEDMETVLIETDDPDGGIWKIVQLLESRDFEPKIEGESLAPGTVPADALESTVVQDITADVEAELEAAGIGGGDGSAPSDAATGLQVIGGVGDILFLLCDTIANGSPVTYKFHVSTTNGFTPGASSFVGAPSYPGGAGAKALFVLRRFPTGHTLAGQAPAQGTTYYCKVIVSDVDGDGPTSSQASGTPATADAASIVAAGSIVGNLVAGSTIVGDNVAANTLTVQHLLIGNLANLIENPGAEVQTPGGAGTDALGWGQGLGWTRSAQNQRSGIRAFRKSGHEGNSYLVIDDAVEVTPGENYYAEVWARSDSSANGLLSLALNWYDSNDIFLSSQGGTILSPPGTSYSKMSVVGVAPSGATKCRPNLRATNTVGTFHVDDWVMRPRVTGELVVDGSITAGKLSVTSLSAISANLGTITAGSITGADIKTTPGGGIGYIQILDDGANKDRIQFYGSTMRAGIIYAETNTKLTLQGNLGVGSFGEGRPKLTLFTDTINPIVTITGGLQVAGGGDRNFLELASAGTNVAPPAAGIRLYSIGGNLKYVKANGETGTIVT